MRLNAKREKALTSAPGRGEIAVFIRTQIMTGQVRFGQKISEHQYAETFGVSRTPVREAFLSLASLGLIKIRPRSGSYVMAFTKNTLQELFEARLLLEAGGVELASDMQKTRLALRLGELMDALTNDVMPTSDDDAFADADTLFHTALVEACGNARLLDMYKPIEACATAVRSRLDKTAAVTNTANRHHHEIYEAISCGDFARFETALGDHLAWVLGMLMRIDELFEPDERR